MASGAAGQGTYGEGVTPVDLLIGNDLLRALDLVGVVVMGITGGAIAARLNFDAVGFATIGMVSGLGGGLLRDLILPVELPAAFTGPWYLVCALSGAAFAFVVGTDSRWWNRLMVLLDVTALGLWAATGTAKSLAYGLDLIPALLLGVVSAVGGGVFRDMMVGRIPSIFGGGPLYATCALITAIGTAIVVGTGTPGIFVLVPVAVGSFIAGLAAWRRWGLPTHQGWQVTLSGTQLQALLRRTRREERRRVALETGAIPVVAEGAGDAFAADHLRQEELGEQLASSDDVGEVDGLDDAQPRGVDRGAVSGDDEEPPHASPTYR